MWSGLLRAYYYSQENPPNHTYAEGKCGLDYHYTKLQTLSFLLLERVTVVNPKSVLHSTSKAACSGVGETDELTHAMEPLKYACTQRQHISKEFEGSISLDILALKSQPVSLLTAVTTYSHRNHGFQVSIMPIFTVLDLAKKLWETFP